MDLQNSKMNSSLSKDFSLIRKYHINEDPTENYEELISIVKKKLFLILEGNKIEIENFESELRNKKEEIKNQKKTENEILNQQNAKFVTHYENFESLFNKFEKIEEKKKNEEKIEIIKKIEISKESSLELGYESSNKNSNSENKINNDYKNLIKKIDSLKIPQKKIKDKEKKKLEKKKIEILNRLENSLNNSEISSKDDFLENSKNDMKKNLENLKSINSLQNSESFNFNEIVENLNGLVNCFEKNNKNNFEKKKIFKN